MKHSSSRHATGRPLAVGVFGKRLASAKRILLALMACLIALWVAAYLFEEGSDGPLTAQKVSTAAYLVVQMLFASAPVEPPPHPVLQGLRLFAPALLPLFGLLAFMSALRVRLALWSRRFFLAPLQELLPMSLRRELVVIIGLGEKGIERAMNALNQETAHVVVLELDEENLAISALESRGATVWVGDGTSAADLRTVFWTRPSKVWVMTGDSGRNLLMLDVIRKLLEESGGADGLRRVEIHARVQRFQDRRDIGSLYPLNHDSPRVWTNVFDHEEEVVSWLVHRHPVRKLNERMPRVLIMGLGGLGRAIARELMVLCHFPGHELPEVVMVDRLDSAYRELEDELPYLRRSLPGVSPFIDCRFHCCDAQSLVLQEYRNQIRGVVSFTHVFIGLGTETANISLAERLWGWEQLIDPTSVPAHIVPMIYDASATDWLAVDESRGGTNTLPPRISPYLLADAHAGEAEAWRESLAQMARRIHDVYVFSADRQSPATDRDRIWTEMLEHDRRSNLAQARYVFNRWYQGDGRWADIPIERLEDEAECEHRRWNAFQLVENVGLVERVNGLYADRITLRGADAKPELRKWVKVHRDIIPFSELDQLDREKADYDRRFVLNQRYVRAAEGSIALPPGRSDSTEGGYTASPMVSPASGS